MEKFWIQGIVKDGQVVLEKPLDLSDGTVVTVMDYDPDDDPRPIEPKLHLTPEEYAELDAFLSKQRDWKDWPEFEARLVKKYGPMPKFR